MANLLDLDRRMQVKTHVVYLGLTELLGSIGPVENHDLANIELRVLAKIIIDANLHIFGSRGLQHRFSAFHAGYG